MIYFDNAATGGFKPSCVTDACYDTVKYLSANPGRSGHRLSVTGADILNDTRKALAHAFGVSDHSRVIFTKNCTEALNTAIFGTLNRDDHVITTVYEHNSVLRPLFFLESSGFISLDIVTPDKNGCFLSAIKKAVTNKTRLIAVTAASNVTGAATDYAEIGAYTKKKNIVLMVDGAQGGGHLPINIQSMNINVLCLAAHKALYGIMGSGVLIFDETVDMRPLTFGGTGTETFNKNQPLSYPERLESGTVNLPAVAALGEGVRFAEKHLRVYSDALFSMTEELILMLSSERNIHLYSLPNRSGIVAFSLGDDSAAVADRLNSEYDIAVRGGFHCAPLMHKYLSTAEGGLIRASLAPENTFREINDFVKAVRKIALSY